MSAKKQKVKNLISNLDLDRLSPILISKKLPDIPIENIYSIVFQLANEDLIKIEYEIACPECSADVKTVTSLNEIPNSIQYDVCNYTFEPDESDIWIFIIPKEKLNINQSKLKNIQKSNNLSLKDIIKIDSFQENIADNQLFQLDIQKFKKMLKEIEIESNDKSKILINIVKLLFSSINDCIVEKNNLYLIITNNNRFDSILIEMGSLIPINAIYNDTTVTNVENFGKYLIDKRYTSGIIFTIKKCDSKNQIEIQKVISHFFLDNGIIILIIEKEDIKTIIDGKSILTILREKKKELHSANIDETFLEVYYDFLINRVPKIPAFLIVVFFAIISYILNQYQPLYFTIITLVIFNYLIVYVLIKQRGKKKTFLSLIIVIITIIALFIILNPYAIYLPKIDIKY